MLKRFFFLISFSIAIIFVFSEGIVVLDSNEERILTYFGICKKIKNINEYSVPIFVGSKEDFESTINSNSFEVSEVPDEEFPIKNDIVLVIDTSGSMGGTKISQAKNAANNFIDKTDLTINRISIVKFTNSATSLIGLSSEKNTLKSKINSLGAGGGTNLIKGYQLARQILSSNGRETITYDEYGIPSGTSRIMIFMSDGIGGNPIPEKINVINNEITTYSIAFGSGADTDTLSNMITNDGEYYFAQNGEVLNQVYENINEKIKIVCEDRAQ